MHNTNSNTTLLLKSITTIILYYKKEGIFSISKSIFLLLGAGQVIDNLSSQIIVSPENMTLELMLVILSESKNTILLQ